MIPPDLEKIVRESWKRMAAPERAEARAEGGADALLQVLARRGLDVTSEQRQGIVTCSDVVQLSAGLDRALIATTSAEIFG
jgi:hypothetical protein